MKKNWIILISLFLLAACCTTQGKPKPETGEANLAGKHFVLASVNGEPFSAGPFSSQREPFLSFNEDMRVSGRACNLFNGAGQMKNGVLTVPQMASTMMMCDDKLNKLERDLFTMLHNGAALTLEDGRLLLVGNGLRFEYRSAAPEK